jgi:hypothetical protein
MPAPKMMTLLPSPILVGQSEGLGLMGLLGGGGAGLLGVGVGVVGLASEEEPQDVVAASNPMAEAARNNALVAAELLAFFRNLRREYPDFSRLIDNPYSLFFERVYKINRYQQNNRGIKE